MKKNSGFTLIELMVTVAIAGIVLAFGLPSLETYIKNDRLTSQINTFVSHLAYARSEAVLRSQQVILCASSNTTSCVGNWGDGWMLFVDADNSSSLTANDPVLRVKQTLSGPNTLTSTMGTSFIYDSRGFAAGGNNGTFSLCDDRGVAHVKSIAISNTGRVRKVMPVEAPTC